MALCHHEIATPSLKALRISESAIVFNKQTIEAKGIQGSKMAITAVGTQPPDSDQNDNPKNYLLA